MNRTLNGKLTNVSSKAGRAGPILAKASMSLLVGMAAGYIWSAPATLLGDAISFATDGQIELVNPRGTVWVGSTAVLIKGPKGSTSQAVLPSPLSWKIQPTLGPIEISFYSSCCTTAEGVKAHITLFDVRVDNTTTSFPISLLTGLGTPWNTLDLSGKLQLRLSNIILSFGKEKRLFGEIVGIASNISTPLTTLPDVGTYKFVINQQGDTPSVQLSTLEGALNLDGQGNFDNGKFRFEGQGQSTPESASALANLLTLLGQKQGNKTLIRLS